MSGTFRLQVYLPRVFAAFALLFLVFCLGRVQVAERFGRMAADAEKRADMDCASSYYSKAADFCQFKAQYYIGLSRCLLAGKAGSGLAVSDGRLSRAIGLLYLAARLDPSAAIIRFNLARLELLRMRARLGAEVDGDKVYALVTQARSRDPQNTELSGRMNEFLYSVYGFVRDPEKRGAIVAPYVNETFAKRANMEQLIRFEILPLASGLEPCDLAAGDCDAGFFRFKNGQPVRMQNLRLGSPFFAFCRVDCRPGRYRLSFSGYSDNALNRCGFVSVFIDDRLEEIVYVDATKPWGSYEAELSVGPSESGAHLLVLRFNNDCYEPERGLNRNVTLKGVRLERVF